MVQTLADRAAHPSLPLLVDAHTHTHFSSASGSLSSSEKCRGLSRFLLTLPQAQDSRQGRGCHRPTLHSSVYMYMLCGLVEKQGMYVCSYA